MPLRKLERHAVQLSNMDGEVDDVPQVHGQGPAAQPHNQSLAGHPPGLVLCYLAACITVHDPEREVLQATSITAGMWGSKGRGRQMWSVRTAVRIEVAFRMTTR